MPFRSAELTTRAESIGHSVMPSFHGVGFREGRKTAVKKWNPHGVGPRHGVGFCSLHGSRGFMGRSEQAAGPSEAYNIQGQYCSRRGRAEAAVSRLGQHRTSRSATGGPSCIHARTERPPPAVAVPRAIEFRHACMPSMTHADADIDAPVPELLNQRKVCEHGAAFGGVRTEVQPRPIRSFSHVAAGTRLHMERGPDGRGRIEPCSSQFAHGIAAFEGTVAPLAKPKEDPVDPSFQAEAVVGAGRGALIVAMFGAGWLGWGLGQARAFTGLVGPVFGLIELFLLACSIHAIRKGRKLRKKYPPIPSSTRRALQKSFWLVVLAEVVALFLVVTLASVLHRPDLAPDGIAMVVGLHFLPLAKLFRSPQLGVIGVLITLWCVVCWSLFRPNALVISVPIGTGILLWAASVSALFRARKIVLSLQ
jgi:hypothetical protein